jgi:two-component system, LytTR family, sensor kinase
MICEEACRQFMFVICQFIQKFGHYAGSRLFKCAKRRYFVILMTSITNYSAILKRFPKIVRKDSQLFWAIIPIVVVLLNISLFGFRFFTNLSVFVVSGIVAFFVSLVLWYLLNNVSALTRSHFASDRYPYKRIFTTICLYAVVTTLFLTAIHRAYDGTGFPGYELDEKRYRWSLITGIVLNVFLTLLLEGVAGFRNWKATMIETEQLKKEYMQSQLLGLKSQVNPHFLFNSLNSLSSLISEDGEKAEKFLDEMSKVYRYLLRNTDDQLVTLETELQFVKSYFFLLKSRYSDGIDMQFDVNESDLQLTLPPLTLQMLVEAAYNQNTVNKDRPLRIQISSINNGWLRVKNNIEKKVVDDVADQSALENVANKFRLLCQQNIVVIKNADHNIIELPLIRQSEKSIA